MKTALISTAALVLAVWMAAPAAAVEWFVDLEGGAAWAARNDARIPGDEGSRISLSDELTGSPAAAGRIRIGAGWRGRHNLSLLAAPLSFSSSGRVDRPVRFADHTFAAGERLEADYRFDSYRLTYRYDLLRGARWRGGLGLTAKIRDATIEIAGESGSAAKDNTGFVPLVAFRLEGDLGGGFGLLLDGDALAGPQGRAEDVLAAATLRLSDRLRARLGYRVLEGGADNDEVYTFALIHYAVLGFEARW